MLNAKQTAALKRVTKKLTAMRQTLPKPEREMLDFLIVGATTEVKGHAARVEGQASNYGRASDQNRLADPTAKKISKRSQGARAEVEGHVAYDTRIGAKKDQGMLKDNGMVREGGMAKDQGAAEVMGHMASTAGAAQTSFASAVNAAVSFNAAMNGYMVNEGK